MKICMQQQILIMLRKIASYKYFKALCQKYMYSVYCFRESIHRNKNQKVTNLQLSSHGFQHCEDVGLELWVFVLQHQVPSPGSKLCIDEKNHTSTLKSEAANRVPLFKHIKLVQKCSNGGNL